MAQELTLYGLKTCDTCRKARRSLENAAVAHRFVDLRESPLSRETITRLLAEAGDAAVNRKSTTWRSLSETGRTRDPVDLLSEHPTLIKRPVIERPDGRLSVGWSATIAAELGAG